MADFPKAKIARLESGSRYQRLFNKDSGTCGIKAGHVILKRGEEIGEHSTNDAEEALVILKGRGRLAINKKENLDFKDDAVLYIPPRTIHNVKNTGNGVLEYIFVTLYAGQKL